MKARSRNMIFASIIAMLLVSISVGSVFAAGPVYGNNPRDNHKLQAEWRNERITLQRYQFLENQVAKWMSVWRKGHPTSRLTRAKKNMYANEVYLALRQAEMLVASHPGFDANGKVVDKVQAAQSVHQLAVHLQKMHFVFIRIFHHHVHHHKH